MTDENPTDSGDVFRLEDEIPEGIPEPVAEVYRAMQVYTRGLQSDKERSLFCRLYDLFSYVMANEDDLNPRTKHMFETISAFSRLVDLEGRAPEEHHHLEKTAYDFACRVLETELSLREDHRIAFLRSMFARLAPNSKLTVTDGRAQMDFANDAERQAVITALEELGIEKLQVPPKHMLN